MAQAPGNGDNGFFGRGKAIGLVNAFDIGDGNEQKPRAGPAGFGSRDRFPQRLGETAAVHHAGERVKIAEIT